MIGGHDSELYRPTYVTLVGNIPGSDRWTDCERERYLEQHPPPKEVSEVLTPAKVRAMMEAVSESRVSGLVKVVYAKLDEACSNAKVLQGGFPIILHNVRIPPDDLLAVNRELAKNQWRISDAACNSKSLIEPISLVPPGYCQDD